MLLTQIKALTFDCHGTLIDWESGMIESLKPLTGKIGREMNRNEILEAHAFHEDGLADLADGLGGSADRERALEIMKDSRIGSFGAVALMLALLSKISLLAVLGTVSLSAAWE